MKVGPNGCFKFITMFIPALIASVGIAAEKSVGPSDDGKSDENSRSSSIATKRSLGPSFDGLKPYGNAELRYAITQYYGEENQRLRSDPAVYGRLQLGARLYSDKLDVSGALGAVKVPASQAVYQKRPEILADFYPLKSDSMNVLWYNMLQFPVKELDRDPTEFNDQDRYDIDNRRGIDATVFTSGLAPLAKAEWGTSMGRIALRLGGDAWTRMYSKPLYVSDNDRQNENLSLVSGSEEPVDKPFEDRALRYNHQESLGVGWTPAFSTKVQSDLGAHIESCYIPQYFRDEKGAWQYTYKVDRRSFYRMRVSYDWSPSITLHNEFHYFMNGFFQENRVDDQRRYRNVLKLAVKL